MLETLTSIFVTALNNIKEGLEKLAKNHKIQDCYCDEYQIHEPEFILKTGLNETVFVGKAGWILTSVDEESGETEQDEYVGVCYVCQVSNGQCIHLAFTDVAYFPYGRGVREEIEVIEIRFEKFEKKFQARFEKTQHEFRGLGPYYKDEIIEVKTGVNE